MIIKRYKKIIHFIIFLFVISCNGQENKKETTSNEKKEISTSKEELYEGKIFYSGDEINNYEFVESKELSTIDSLSYSIYKANDKKEFIISIEKFISNEDQEKYKIIKVFFIDDYSPNEIKINYVPNESKIVVNQNNKVLKEWGYKSNKSRSKFINWDGKYNGEFLRLKEESADPRAWGQITIDINGKKAQFKLDSYVEIVEDELEVVNNTNNQLTLKKSNDDKTLKLIKINNTYFLEGNLIDSIVQFNEQYDLKKIK